MIRVAPDTLAGQVLHHVVLLPGALDAAAIADLLWREPAIVGPLTSASYAIWRAEVAVFRAGAADRSRRVSTALHRLQQQGLIEPCAGVAVAAWHEERVARLGAVRALDLAADLDEDEDRARDLGAHLRLLQRVRECPVSVRELLSEGGGWARLAYADLGAWGVIETPQRRRPTARGIALVQEWK